MPNENEKTKRPSPNSPFPDESDDSADGTESVDSPKGFFRSMFDILIHLFPALKEAFVSGTTAFKMRVRGITHHKQNDDDEEDEKGERLKGPYSDADEPDDEDKPPSQPKQGFFMSKFSDASKSVKILLACLITLIIIISVGSGLYLGGMFDEEKEEADTPEKDGTVAAAPQEDSRRESFFDSIFGKKNRSPATPQEQLAAMHINLTPNNFVKHAGKNDLHIVRLFVQAGMSPDTRRPLDGFTPLMAAAAFGRLEMAEFLLDESGADINAQDNEGQTALMKAARHNRPEMVEMLLSRNANYNIADKKGTTALNLAKEHPQNSALAQIFAKFDIDIFAVAEEPAKKEVPLSPPSNTTSAQSDTTGGQPRQSRHLEISVHEFLKFLQSSANQ